MVVLITTDWCAGDPVDRREPVDAAAHQDCVDSSRCTANADRSNSPTVCSAAGAEDSGGKSGGQKEKLAYTVIAASLSYQYGLAGGRANAFRFVMIDEPFGRGSEESTKFGLELFSRLGLQLLTVTPLQKIQVIENYVDALAYVRLIDPRSQLISMPIE